MRRSTLPGIDRPAIRPTDHISTLAGWTVHRSDNSYTPTPVTNAAPSAVAEGTSGPAFHGWTGTTGQTDFVDTWTPVRQTTGAGTFTVDCPPPDGGPEPGASPQPGGGNPPPTVTPPAKKPPKPKPHPDKPGKPKLVIEKTANAGFARPSSVVGYTITVWNKGDGAARRVKVCDKPSAGLDILRSEPAASGQGATCWKLKSLAAGKERVFRVTAEIDPSSDRGVERNAATVSAANIKGVRSASAGVRVKPLPDTACGSSLFRPDIAPRC